MFDRTPQRIRGAVLAVWLGLAPAGAYAQEPDATATLTDEARSYYLEGNKALAKEDWKAAEAAFRKAWGLSPTYDVAANLGQAVYKLGSPREAAELFAYSLRTAPPSAKPAARAQTAELLQLAKKQVATVRIHVDVKDAIVVVDGKPIDAVFAGDEVFVDPGTRTLEARAPGYEGKAITIDAVADTSREVTLPLTPIQPARPSLVPVISLGALAVAGIGVGIGTAVVSNDKGAAADAQLATIRATSGPCDKSSPSAACKTLHGLRGEQRDFGNTAIWSFVGAGAAGAGAVIYWLVTRPEAPRGTGASVTPVVGTGFGGVEVHGTW